MTKKLTNDAIDVDFSKKKLIRDALGGIIPQYYDAKEDKFKPLTANSVSGGIDGDGGDIDENVPPKPIIYGVKIDTLNSNPESAVTYINDAVDFTPARGNDGNFDYGSWLDKFPFNLIKPCVVKEKKVNYFLDPNDYSKKEDGSPADITSGDDGDVMVKFPKIYWKFERLGTDLYIFISNTKIDDDYKPLAHTRGEIENDEIFIGAYLGSKEATKLRSLSAKMPHTTEIIGNFRKLAQANGEGYEQMAFYPMTMLQILFLIMFKSRDSQTALGRGYVDHYEGPTLTGGADKKGLFYSSTSGQEQVKFCGIEDFWGNAYCFIDGMVCDNNRNILISNDKFNDTGIDYINHGQGALSNLSGFTSDIQGTSETGFLIKTAEGSETTYYSDYSGFTAGCVPHFGGCYSHGSYSGAFRIEINASRISSDSTVSARLSLF